MALPFSAFWRRLRKVLIVLAVLAIGTVVSGCGYRNAPKLEENAKGAWGEVQSQYQRRTDLVPGLVATVETYTQQEREVLAEVSDARTKTNVVTLDATMLTDAAKFRVFQSVQNRLSVALGRLLDLKELHPDLRSSQSFIALQSQLEDAENRIAVARRDYTTTVQAYNTEVRTFPGLIWARLVWGAKTLETFPASRS